MKYRPEIDGLRALAILPVVFFHAKLNLFRGGFVGVDVFFVISGYLITSIILEDLQNNRFSLVSFYERRARRILPALFTIMTVSSVFAYRWMLPDELKNFGQSLVATALFCNNVLLAITTNYWSLSSEFKPLLHTWTLGVEEQYYIFFPLFLMLCWAFLRKRILLLFGVLAVLSLALVCWGVFHSPANTFYLLPSRAWELLAGAASAYYLRQHKGPRENSWKVEALGIVGLLLIVGSVFLINSASPISQIFTVFPVCGSALIVLFASGDTIAGKMLSHKVLVGIGLISYSLYLWHQPLLAFARVYSKQAPGLVVRFALIALSFLLSYLSWRFIERPFRDKKKTSRRLIFSSAFAISFLFVVFGFYLDRSYGAISRIYDTRVAPISALDKRIYNERVFQYKTDHFTDAQKLKILVIGNSFGRDLINMTTETFDTKNVEFVYRDDVGPCLLPFQHPFEKDLLKNAQVIVFAGWDITPCIQKNIAYAKQNGKEIFYIGSKQFGYNLNWILRLKHDELPNQYNQMLPETMDLERQMVAAVPAENYISLLAPVVRGDYIPITDENGFLLSTDRDHVTKFGAIYFGKRALLHSRYGAIVSKYSSDAM